MGKTFILGNSQNLSELNESIINIPSLNDEVEIHNWVIELFRGNEIDKLIIEVENDPILALQIGYHIRLSIEELSQKVLIPILFVSKLSLNSIMLSTEVFSQILATKGIYFSESNHNLIKSELPHLKALNESEYLTKFLKIIHFQPDETIGRHSLANIWGAYAMDKASNSNALPAESEFKKKLYFKYISSFNNIDKLKPSRLKVLRKIKIGVANSIKAQGKKILLIDDEADRGWETVLRTVFKTSTIQDFVVINEKVKDYEALSESSKRIIEGQNFDLYLIDLRLNGLEEDDTLKTEAFSGMNVMQKIKSFNKGNQVIIFTASNKSWNLKALLDGGADGYYMKESPEYNFSTTISEQNYRNFKENVEKCFAKDYLREIYVQWENTKNTRSASEKSFITESDTALDIAWDQAKNNYLDFSFLTLFQSLETLSSRTYQTGNYYDTINNITTIDKTDQNQNKWVISFIEDRHNGSYFGGNAEWKEKSFSPTTLFKISCLLKIKHNKDDAFLKNIGSLNKLRNYIAHKGAKKFSTKNDIISLLKILEEIRGN